MASAATLLRHLIWALVLVLALSKGPGVSKEEYLKMKRYLSFINRPPVKTIKTKYGHIFDCVEIYKQPSMDHPSLQNHTIKMKPSSLPQGVDNEPSTSKRKAKFGLPNGGCPPNTVPIRRVEMRDLLRAGSVSNFVEKPYSNSPHKYAVMGTKSGNYLGTEMSLSLWTPQLADGSQFSLTQFWVVNRQSGQLNTIEAGWQVYPQIYGDAQTHLFTYWTADGYGSTGCYNLKCPGFVQVSQELVPGSVLEPVSTIGGEQHELHLYVHKDEQSGDWWLTYGKDYHSIGYWPSNLFNGLDKYADEVQWGGETISGTNSDSYPPMGSGQFADQGPSKSAYIKEIQVVDASGQKVDAPTETTVIQTNGCYNLYDGGNGMGEDGRFFYYGGPGGTCNN